MVLIYWKYEIIKLLQFRIYTISNFYSLDLYKFVLATIYISVNVPLWKMKFTPRVYLPQVKNHWSS